MEDYVARVVSGELAVGALDPAIADSMLRLQAVVARTWAMAHLGRHARQGYDFCATTHCQVARAESAQLPANLPAIRRAVQATSGQVLLWGGRAIEAVFHADCGGATSSANAVWGGDGRPYLRPVEDQVCGRRADSAWRFVTNTHEARQALNADPRTAVGRRLDDLRVLEQDSSGRATLVALDGERSPIVRGEELRSVLVRHFGTPSVRSPLFSVRRQAGGWLFTGRGRGHGVGLCQQGAMARLRSGASVGAVLAAYYPGTELTPADVRATARRDGDPGRRGTGR
jgi:stage II sporulation protein D